MDKPDKKRIIFVCTGNTCRSPMAEYIFKDFLKQKGAQKYFSVTSAGLAATEGEPVSGETCKVLKSLGVKYSEKRRAKRLKITPALKKALIITMSRGHKEMMTGLNNVISAHELIGEDITDPYGGDAEDYKTAALLIKRLIKVLWEKHLKKITDGAKNENSDRQ